MKTPSTSRTRPGSLLLVLLQALLGSVTALAAEPQVVTITAVDSESAESTQGRLGTNAALFRLARTAGTETALRVHLTTLGEAGNGLDYLRIPEIVEIPAGRESVEIVLTPLNDTVTEPTERARVKILPSESYRVGDRAEASVFIANVAWESRPTLRLVSPDPYRNYRYPTNLVLRAEGTGWDGQLGRVEFRSGTDVIGVREQAPFELVWTNPPAGSHSLSAGASDRARAYETESPAVLVQVFLNNGLPMVSVVSDDPDASEMGDPGAFLFWRADSHLEKPLSVQVAYGMAEDYPIAVNGTDFEALPNPLTFPAGVAVKRLTVVPRPDEWLEGTEAVGAALALGDGYGVSSRSRAVVRITDSSINRPAVIRFVTPTNGQGPVTVGTPVTVVTVLEDPDRLPHRVTIMADGRALGRLEQVQERASLTNTFRFPGDFILTAVAVDGLGLATTSAPVTLHVRPENSPPFVRIVSPERNAHLPGVRSLLIEAQAGDLDGTVRSVVFWVGTNRVGTVTHPVDGTTNVFRLGTADVSPGFQVLRAEAIDDQQSIGSSAPLPIMNGGPYLIPPGIRLVEQPLSHSSFAIGARGVLFQWDYFSENSGMLGQTNPIPVALPLGTGPIETFSSGVNSGSPIREGVALENAGEVTRWYDPLLAPGRLPKPEGVQRWLHAAAGTARQFAIGDNGELYAWGNNSEGTLGLGPNAPESVFVLQPTLVPRPEGVRGWKQVSATTHTLALDADGRLYAWGRNGSGQLGLGSGASTTEPVRTPTLVRSPEGTTWKQVAAGASHSLGLTSRGDLYAWGNNESGQLGLGRLFPTVDSPQPVPLPPGASRWIMLAVGASHSLAATDDGSVYAWGANLYGQVGFLPDPPQPWPGEFVPQRVEWPAGVSEWLAFTGGASHSLAVGDDGRVYRWGKTTSTDHQHALHAVPGATPEVLWSLSNQRPTLVFSVSQTNNAVVPVGATVSLQAEAHDADSPIQRVEFFDGSKLVKSDEAPPYVWALVLGTSGRHDLRARAVDAQGAETWSETVSLFAEPNDHVPVVWITCETPTVRESMLDAWGMFRLHRSGETAKPLAVMLAFEGTATRGTDYTLHTERFEFPAGASTTDIRVFPKSDSLSEPDETIVAGLLPSDHYLQGVPAAATMTILANGAPANHPPTVRWLTPTNGAVFIRPATIELAVHAEDADGLVQTVSFYAGSDLLGTTTKNPDPVGPRNPFLFQWINAPRGEHQLTAVATDNDGASTRSEVVQITIEADPGRPPFWRELPVYYVPGEDMTVLVVSKPPANTAAWALEDSPPAGWTVSRVSHEGVWDAGKGKVKFGPFLDAEPRTLSYDVRPPNAAQAPVEFSGAASADGIGFRIGGDRVLVPGTLHHPADQAPADFSVSMLEATAYAAAWRHGTDWSVPPNPIPMDYVTRAGLLWRSGEEYHFGRDAGAPPLCWVPGPVPIRTDPGHLDFPAAGTAARVLPDGSQGLVSLVITPQVGVSGYAVEELLPPAATASQISHDGLMDFSTGCIRWGPFYDDALRTLTYTLSAPSGSARVSPFAGRASFDGRSVEVGGPNAVSPGTSRGPWIGAGRTAEGAVDLLVFGNIGGTCVVEGSVNTVLWEPIETLVLNSYPHRVRVCSPGGDGKRFFRVRVVEGP